MRVVLGATLGVVLAIPVAAHEIKVFASQQLVPQPGAKTTVFLS